MAALVIWGLLAAVFAIDAANPWENGIREQCPLGRSGVSLEAAGWTRVGEAGGGTWSRKERPRVDMHPTQTKIRWERTA